MPVGWVKQRIGQRNGGVIVQRKGTGHRFTSETGRKAVSKRWKRHKKSRSGYRLGESVVKRTPALDLDAIRARHSSPLFAGVWFETGSWRFKRAADSTSERLSERTALALLGYHKRTRSQNVPVKILAPVLKRRKA